jgi:histidinol-phosphate/aromatic aminotransferase/cobyric acid decarboxylase-like protein
MGRAERHRLIVDESFMDFADTSDSQTLLSEAILQENRHLTVIKSISKSFGVPAYGLGLPQAQMRTLSLI